MRKKGIVTFIGITILLCFAGLIYFEKTKASTTVMTNISELESVKVQQNGINIMIDPRIELLSALQLNSNDNVTQLNFDYKIKMLEHFINFNLHEAVNTYQEMANKEFGYDAPPTTMLYYKNPMDLTKNKELDSSLVARAGGEKSLDHFIENLNSYAKISKFDTFYSKNISFYKELVEEVSESIKEVDMLSKLEAYYGEKQNSYNIILAPMLFDGGFGPRVKTDNGKYDIYGIIGPSGVRNGMPNYNIAALENLVLHEFGHSFVNPITQKHLKEVNKYTKLFDKIKLKMEEQAYSKWEICVNEHILRAIVARITLAELGEKEYRKILNIEKSYSFAYIEAICKKLEMYENNRDKYKTFEEFYPELLKTFDELANSSLTEDFYKIRFAGTINSALEMGNPVVFIVPTNEKSKSIQEEIHEFVKKMKDSFVIYKDAEIITDAKALGRNLASNTVITYGTMEGNLWLGSYKDGFPFRISSEGIAVDGDSEMDVNYNSKNQRFITAIPNPNNPFNAVVIYTAQEASEIPGITNVFHGPTAYVVAKGQEVVKSGDYNK